MHFINIKYVFQHNLPHVRDGPRAYVDATAGLSQAVPVAQLGHQADGIHSGVLCQCVGDDLQSLDRSGLV